MKRKMTKPQALGVAMLFSIKDTAILLGLSIKTVERLCRRGELTARRIGRVWRIPRSTLEAFCRKDHRTGEENQQK